MERLTDILFYALEKSIKSYRQFAQQSINQHGFDITIDQWLVLKAIHANPDWTQQQIAEATFKDYASVTRMIDLLVKKQYLKRDLREDDRRRFILTLTKPAITLLEVLQPVIENNREIALKNIGSKEALEVHAILNTIISNCNLK